MITEMVRLRLLGPRERIGEVLDVLQDVGAFHPARVKSTRVEALAGGSTRDRRARQLQHVLTDLDFALERLPGGPDRASPDGEPPPPATVADLARWARLARRTRRELARLESEHAELAEERAVLERYRAYQEGFSRLLPREPDPARIRTLPLVLEAGHSLDRLRDGLDALLGEDYELRTEPLEGDEVAAVLLMPAGRSARVDELLGEAGVRELPAPPGLQTRSLAEAVPAIYDRLVVLDEREQALKKRRDRLADERATELATVRVAVQDRLAELDALGRVATTHSAFVLEGWVPEELESELRNRLRDSFGGLIVVEHVARETWDEVAEETPVVLHNPRLLRPFEAITRMLPLPRYGSIDPTPFVAVFFPAFFGLILGDVGYGVVLAIVAIVLHVRSRDGTMLRSVSEIAGACAAASIVFGFLYGEAFGDLGRRLVGLRPLAFDREEALVPFLALAVAIGFVHIVLGLVLGMVAALRHRQTREAAGRGISALMVVLVAVALLAAVKILPGGFFTPVVIALLVAFPLLVMAEGLLAPLELLSTLGNVLSYARIMALGTASVMMAVVANRMVGATGSVLVGVVFALLFHTVNFALGIFGPTVHGLRLHYVEFFGKFYSPGGTSYRPLRHWEPEAPDPGESSSPPDEPAA